MYCRDATWQVFSLRRRLVNLGIHVIGGKERVELRNGPLDSRNTNVSEAYVTLHHLYISAISRIEPLCPM